MRFKHLIRVFIALQLLIAFTSTAKAQQNWDTLPWKSYSDYRLQNLNKSYIATNILYDRVFPLANVDEYSGLPAYTNTDTTHSDHWTQAYYEIYNSAYNTTGWIHPDSLDNLIKTNGANNEHPIGIFFYTFNTLDTNALQDHLIDTLSNGQFLDVANRPRSPYFTTTSFLAAPLIADGQVVEEGDHLFYIDPKFFLHNEYLNITQIRIDFGDGQGEWVVDNPFSGNNGAKIDGAITSILKHLDGLVIGRIIVIGLDLFGQTVSHGSPFKLFVKKTKQYQPLTACKGLQQWVIETPQSRLDPINAQYGNPQVDYTKDGQPLRDVAYFYFVGNGSVCNTNVLTKPVLFIDGFDPTNTRGVQQIYEDYINVNTVRNNQQVKFGDYMLSEGYDFVILDFKHGNDLLERNAMTLVSLIERLNQTYGSTMQQGITLIGPSMGSLIAQYALAYMEANNIPHNVKTYISFDGCHQGANVPIGLQNFVEYFTKRGIFKKNKTIREGLYNGLAARQMLAHHVSANSQFPAPDALRTIFLQNLAAVNEYPQLCRKVAIINGTNTGAINPFHPGPSETLLRIYTQRKGWKSLWGACEDKICMKLDWNCYTTPNSGTFKVMDNWTVEPIFNLLFWAPLGKTNRYADAAWGNSSQDNAPGGTFGTLFGTNPGDINESNFVFLLKEAMYLLTGSKRTGFYQNINEFTMMPSYSSADLRFPNKNLYMKWDDQYLCGNTPFDYVYAPPVNERHVFVSASGSQWFENEVRCATSSLPTYINPIMTGNGALCNSGLYTIVSCLPIGNITWSAQPAGIVNISAVGSQATITKITNGIVTISASITTCNNTFTQTISKTVRVGTLQPGPISWTWNAPPNRVLLDVDDVPGATSYKWYLDGVLKATTTTSSYQLPMTGNVSCGNFYYFGVKAVNSCGTSDESYVGAEMPPCGGFAYMISPNPSADNITIESNDEATTLDNKKRREIKEIEVHDKMGVIKQKQKFGKGQTTVNISVGTLPNDVYTLRIFDGQTWQSCKIVVQH